MKKLMTLLFGLFMLLPCLSYAQDTFTWTGEGVDNSWDTGGNWLKNGGLSGDTPKNNDIAIIDPSVAAFTNQPVVDGGGKTKVSQLQIDGAGTILSIGGSSPGLDVTDQLTMGGGTIEMNDKVLTVKSGMTGTLTQSGGVINIGNGILDVMTLTQTGGTINIGTGVSNVVSSGNFSGDLNITGGSLVVSSDATKGSGTITLASSATFEVRNDLFIGGGAITITSGDLKTTNNYNQSGGTVDLGGSVFSPGNAVSISGGSLKNGTVQCDDFAQISNAMLEDLTLTKPMSSSNNNSSSGNNLWAGTCTISNQSADQWSFQTAADDNISGNVSFSGNGITLANAGMVVLINDGSLSISGGAAFGTGALKFSGAGAKAFTNNGGTTASINTMEIDDEGNGGTATLSGDMLITNKLTTPSGIIFPPAEGLNLAPGVNTNISNDDGYVSGVINFQVDAASTTLPFPIGKAPVFRPATLTINFNAVTVATVTAQVIRSSAADLGYAIPEESDIENVSDIMYWSISCPACSGNVASAFVTLEYRDDAAEGVTDPSKLRVVKSAAGMSGMIWEDLGGSGVSGTIASGVFTEFSNFALGSVEGNILPVELTRFEASVDGDDINLYWETASETNNDYFLVQHSFDGVSFENLAEIDGAGDSYEPLKYEWRHADAPAGINYYRLKQVDFDGRFDYSAILSEKIAIEAVQLYPNPAFDEVQIITESTESLQYEVFDAFGRLIHRGEVGTEGRVNIRDLPAGVYVLQVRTVFGTMLASEKIIKKK